eukprot:1178133-Prorocentrum_minimum.AAC.5
MFGCTLWLRTRKHPMSTPSFSPQRTGTLMGHHPRAVAAATASCTVHLPAAEASSHGTTGDAGGIGESPLGHPSLQRGVKGPPGRAAPGGGVAAGGFAAGARGGRAASGLARGEGLAKFVGGTTVRLGGFLLRGRPVGAPEGEVGEVEGWEGAAELGTCAGAGGGGGG